LNPTHYFGIIVRLFAIALFIFGVGRLEYVFNFSSYTETYIGPSIVFSLLSSVLPILISLVIWFFPLTVAKKVLPPTIEKIEPISSLSALTVFVIAIGTFSLYNAISDSVYWITIVHVFVRDEFGNISKLLSNDEKAAILSTVIEFVVAIILIARAKSISRLLMKFAK